MNKRGRVYFKRGEKREENITLNTQLHVINAIKLYETVFVVWCVYCMFIICLLYVYSMFIVCL